MAAIYSMRNPYVVHRADQEDGSITYEVYDERPDSYRFICAVHEDDHHGSADDGERMISAKKEAEQIARALNLLTNVEAIVADWFTLPPQNRTKATLIEALKP